MDFYGILQGVVKYQSVWEYIVERLEQANGIPHRSHGADGFSGEQPYLAMVGRELFHVYEVVKFPLAMKRWLLHRKRPEMYAEVYVATVRRPRPKYQLDVLNKLYALTFGE